MYLPVFVAMVKYLFSDSPCSTTARCPQSGGMIPNHLNISFVAGILELQRTRLSQYGFGEIYCFVSYRPHRLHFSSPDVASSFAGLSES